MHDQRIDILGNLHNIAIQLRLNLQTYGTGVKRMN